MKFQIHGYINNEADSLDNSILKDGDTIILKFYNIKDRRDTAVLKSNRFVFQGEVPEPSIAMLEYGKGGNLFLIDSSNYDFFLNLKKTEKKYLHYDGEIKTNSTFYNEWEKLSSQKANLIYQRNEAIKLLEKATNSDSILLMKNEINLKNSKISDVYIKLAHDKPKSYLTAYVVPASPNFNYAEYISIYDSLPEKVKNSFYGRNFYNKLMIFKDIKNTSSATFENDNLDFNKITRLNTLDVFKNNSPIDESVFSKSKYTLIDFWASWCIPCRAMNEELKKNWNNLKKNNIQVIGFSFDTDFNKWEEALKKDNANWLQVSNLEGPDCQIAQILRIGFIPNNILVDSNGKIIKRNISLEELLNSTDKSNKN